MSASKSVRKKSYNPPTVPDGSTGGLVWRGGAGDERSKSVPRAVNESTPPLATRLQANSAYPTPGTSARGPRQPARGVPPPRGETPLPAPDFRNAIQPPAVEDPNMSDSGEESGSDSESSSESEDSDSSKDTGDSSTDESASGSDEDEDEDEDEEESSSGDEGSPPPVKQKQRKQKAPAARVRVKVEDEAPMRAASEAEDRVTSIESLTPAERSTAMTHTRNSIMSLCGGKRQVTELAELELQYKPSNEPLWVDDNGIVAIHPELSFDDNMRGFGHLFDDVVTDTSRMSHAAKPFLSRVDPAVFRSCLNAGVFSTLRETWKAVQNGTGDARAEKRRTNARRASRKGTKSSNRRQALKETELEFAAFAFLVDPAFQSSDSSEGGSSDEGSKGKGTKKKRNKKNKKRGKKVKVHSYRTAKTTRILGALDVKYESMKTRSGNPQYEVDKYVKTDSVVPKLKTKGLKVSKWAVSQQWLDENPEFERKSRGFIAPNTDIMPQADVVERLLHDYEPDDREYANVPQSSAPKASQAQPSVPVQSDTSTPTLSVSTLAPAPPDATLAPSDPSFAPNSTPGHQSLVPAPGTRPSVPAQPYLPIQPPAHLVAPGAPQVPTNPGIAFGLDYTQPNGHNPQPGHELQLGYDDTDGSLQIDYMDFSAFEQADEGGDVLQNNQPVHNQQVAVHTPGGAYVHPHPSYPMIGQGGQGGSYLGAEPVVDDSAGEGKSSKRTVGKKKEKAAKEQAAKEKAGKKKAGKEKAGKKKEGKGKGKKSKDPEPSNPPTSRKRKPNGREVEDEEPVAGSSKPRVKPGDIKKAKLTGLFGY